MSPSAVCLRKIDPRSPACIMCPPHRQELLDLNFKSRVLKVGHRHVIATSSPRHRHVTDTSTPRAPQRSAARTSSSPVLPGRSSSAALLRAGVTCCAAWRALGTSRVPWGVARALAPLTPSSSPHPLHDPPRPSTARTPLTTAPRPPPHAADRLLPPPPPVLDT